MRVLLIKTSSMGDIIHTLPALTDAGIAHPSIRFDWVVEEGFKDIPAWHPLVERVIPVRLRAWRKALFSAKTHQEWRAFRKELALEEYDYILDAQGLVKSAWLGLLANGLRVGLNWRSAREPLASLFYQKKCRVNFHQQAVTRMRLLFADSLNYDIPNSPPDFGIPSTLFKGTASTEKYVVFLHGTTWKSKLYPEAYWIQLANMAASAGYRIKISGASDEEIARAHRIATACSSVDVMPRLTISEMAELLANAAGAVAVDTGFGHLAGALNIPVVSIYGATNPEFTGTIGKRAVNLAAHFPCSPCLSRECTYKKPSVVIPACYETVPPEKVWQTLLQVISI
jgi:heptosyltransferase-1